MPQNIYTVSQVNGYILTMTADDSELSGMTMELSASMKGRQMDMSMSVDMPASDLTAGTSMHLSLTMDGAYQTTSTIPSTQPPAGASIVDLTEFLFPSQDI